MTGWRAAVAAAGSPRARLGIKLTISFGLLAYILSRLPLDQLWGALAGADPWLVAVGIGLTMLMRLFSAQRMRLILLGQGLVLSLWSVFAINFRSSFFSSLLPGQVSGAASRWLLLKRRGGAGAGMVLAIIFDRLNDLLVVVGLGLAASFYARPQPQEGIMSLVFAAVLLCLLAIQFAVSSAHCLDVYEYLVHRIGLARIGSLDRLSRKIIESARQYHQLSRGTRLRLWLLSLVSNIAGICSYAAMAGALDMTVGVASLIWLRSALVVLIFLPISLSGIGVRDGALIVLLGEYGVLPAVAVALSLLLLLRSVISATIGGSLLAWDWLVVTSMTGPARGKENP